MLDRCSKTSNTNGSRCARCGAIPTEIHEAGPLFGKHPHCPACCPVCSPVPRRETTQPKPAAATSSRWDTPSAPRPRDPFYFDESRRDDFDYFAKGGATRLRRGR